MEREVLFNIPRDGEGLQLMGSKRVKSKDKKQKITTTPQAVSLMLFSGHNVGMLYKLPYRHYITV